MVRKPSWASFVFYQLSAARPRRKRKFDFRDCPIFFMAPLLSTRAFHDTKLPDFGF
jgi:hypothetical protein